MATSKEFHDYILEQLKKAGDVTTRKMMGEYCVYYQGKLIGDICDNCLLLKPANAVRSMLPDAEKAYPYEGAKTKMVMVEDVEDIEKMRKLLEAMYQELPEPKKKASASKKKAPASRKTAGSLREEENKDIQRLSKLPNIGKTVEEQLIQAGIHNAQELKETGAKQAWLKIQKIDASACIHRLLALEGAIRGVKKTMLPEEVKKDLKEFYEWNKKY